MSRREDGQSMVAATKFRCHEGGISGHGNADAGVVVLGIAPGQQEVINGAPFVGPAGSLLDAMLKAGGWSRDKVYCTNLICHWNNSPSQDEIGACAPRLHDELEAIRPKLLVVLGSIPSQQIVGQPIGKCRGKISWSDNLQCYVLPTYHPAAILRGGHHLGADIVRDLWKISDVMDMYLNPGRFVPPNHRFIPAVNDKLSAEAYLSALRPGDVVSVDVETSTRPTGHDDPDPFGGELICVGMSSKLGSAVFSPASLKGLKWPDYVKWTFHNGMSDYQAIRKYLDVQVPIVEDTLLMSYSIDERTT